MLSVIRHSRNSKLLVQHVLRVVPKAGLHTTQILRAITSPNDSTDMPVLGKLANSIKSAVLGASPVPVRKVPQGAEDIVFTGGAASWNQAIKEAQSLVTEKSEKPLRIIDPAKLVGDDLKEIKANISKLLGSGHPFLDTVARHYFSGEGKHIRPLLVLLIAQATSIADKKQLRSNIDYKSIDTPISHGLENITTSDVFDRKIHYTPSVTDQGCTILPTQRRLAEISEMIHTASLLHDDVIDASMTRRNLPSANASFGNRMAVLGGDFLLARASLALARLRNAECIELMATCIANLVEGEFMQLKNTKEESGGKVKKLSTFDHYMDKTYMKTGSLIAQSCKASAVLGGSTKDVANVAFDFGKNLGLAFQVIRKLYTIEFFNLNFFLFIAPLLILSACR